MKRGDVYTAATGSGFGSKPRPVVIIQADAYVDAPVVMVAPFVDKQYAVDDIRPLVDPDPSNCLEKQSAVATTSLIAVRRAKFGKRIGALAPADRDRVDVALRLALGLA